MLTTVFDGVPSLPSAEQMCSDYADKKVTAMKEEMAGVKTDQSAHKSSMHEPYSEKNCNGCHDKTTGNGLVASKEDLCFRCHTNFIKGTMVHGPVAVRDCLACHVPHDSSYPSLLKVERSQVCLSCHREKRAALALHERVAERKMLCVDCHDPHFSNVQYFLK